MPSNRRQRDLKATSLIVGGSSASTTSEILGGGTYVKRDKPGNVQSKIDVLNQVFCYIKKHYKLLKLQYVF